MNKEEFIKSLKELNITLTDKQLFQLDKYYNILIEENNKYNLTTITKKEDAYLKHFYDSLTIKKIIDLNNEFLCDVGTGAGFPGLVLKIVFPNLKVDLLDSTEKKCKFLEKIISELELDNIQVINARAEDYSKSNRDKYDVVVSRAVAPLKYLLEYSIPMLKINGKFIAMKANISEELENINNYYTKMYLSGQKIINFQLPKENSERTLYQIEKQKKTPVIYPRAYNQIKKKEI